MNQAGKCATASQNLAKPMLTQPRVGVRKLPANTGKSENKNFQVPQNKKSIAKAGIPVFIAPEVFRLVEVFLAGKVQKYAWM